MKKSFFIIFCFLGCSMVACSNDQSPKKTTPPTISKSELPSSSDFKLKAGNDPASEEQHVQRMHHIYQKKLAGEATPEELKELKEDQDRRAKERRESFTKVLEEKNKELDTNSSFPEDTKGW